MYEAHPTFIQPESDGVRVWRYMDFTKLVSLIDSECLFFSRVDKLGDPFEGSWPRINVHARQDVPEDIPAEHRKTFGMTMKTLSRLTKQWPKYAAVNCWHMNEHESAAMWKLYLKSNEGIAVQSSYKNLRDSIIDNEKVFWGIVKYIDYDNESIDAGNLLSALVHKRRSFEHEREVRALVMKPPIGDENDPVLYVDRETIAHGLKIKVDLPRLIENIYVAPSTPNWFADLVRALIHRYGHDFEVVHSRLDQEPLF